MPENKTSLRALISFLFALTIALPLSSQATIRSVNADDYANRHVTCHHPVRLTRDCSIWQGPTRPIAFGDFADEPRRRARRTNRPDHPAASRARSQR